MELSLFDKSVACFDKYHPIIFCSLHSNYENNYSMEIRWVQNGEFVTNLTLKIDRRYWRSMVSRIHKIGI